MSKIQAFFKVSLVRFVFAVVSILLLAVGFQPVSAAPSGQGLEISPPLIELNVDPGQTVSFDIRLRNITAGPLVTKGSIEDFVAQGEEGQPKLVLDQKAEPSPYSIKNWAKSPLPDLTLVSREAKVTKVSLEVPKDASPGGHYGVIRFSALPPELAGSGVSLSASLGTLVLINVSGNVHQKASLAEFFASQNGQKKSFFETGPVTFVERIKNEGNVHIKPIGTLRVTNTFGNEVKVLSVNERAGNILPDSIRRFEQTLDKRQLIGRYNVEANIQYNGHSLKDNLSFWVIPYKLVAIGLGVLILSTVIIVKGIKRYNRYILAKGAKNRHGDT